MDRESVRALFLSLMLLKETTGNFTTTKIGAHIKRDTHYGSTRVDSPSFFGRKSLVTTRREGNDCLARRYLGLVVLGRGVGRLSGLTICFPCN